VHAVERGRALDDVLESLAAKVPGDQRGLLGELAYGTCRWYFRLKPVADQLLRKPLKARDRVLRPLILVGLYQILYTRVPAHAAVAETVAASRVLGKPAASGLVNGVLRRFQRESASLLAVVDKDPGGKFAFPGWLLKAMRTAWPDRWEAVLAGSNARPPMTLRVNLSRGSRADYAAELAAAGIAASPVAGVASALVLDQALPVERLPGFFEGRVSVQDSAAQIAAHLLAARQGDRVLDACAAPGGKTGHIAEAGPGLAELVALDVDPRRLERVSENLERLGVTAQVVAGDAAAPGDSPWAERAFERILLDAPCSATGVIRRHPDIKMLRRASDVPALVKKQRQMLEALWPRLAPGGILLYCTCSVLQEENAMQVERFTAGRPDAVVTGIDLPFGRRSGAGWQILPGEGGADGFFYALLEKRPA
jgi:16S rRNA (cytosine967-C5)-methyltransferase